MNWKYSWVRTEDSVRRVTEVKVHIIWINKEKSKVEQPGVLVTTSNNKNYYDLLHASLVLSNVIDSIVFPNIIFITENEELERLRNLLTGIYLECGRIARASDARTLALTIELL